MKLTPTAITKLESPAKGKDRLVKDDVQPGLFVRVSSKGSKTYLVQYTFAGIKRRIPLGAPTLANARSAAAEFMGKVAAGRDPAADRKAAALETKRKAARETLTLAALIHQWDTLHLAGNRKRYAYEAVRAIKVAFAKQLPLPAASLDRDTVIAVRDKITASGSPQMAARTMVYGRSMFGWAIANNKPVSNPFVNLKIAAVVKRDRVLTDDEMRSIWQGTAAQGSFNTIVRLLLLTGQRLNECAGVAWSELSADLATWTLPASRTKNGVEHNIPLAPQVQAILRAAKRYEGNPLVFPGEGGVFSGWHRARTRLEEASGVTGWTLHDLRRTCATGLQKLGVRLEVTEACLNHVGGSRGGIVGVYQRHDWKDEKRAALTAWGAHVEAIVEGREQTGNVTPIRALSA